MSTGQLRVIRQLLEENHIYEELPNKAIHKLSYLVYKRANERGFDVSIPYFWYRYGVLTQQTPQDPVHPSSPSLDTSELEGLNQITDTVLERYYDTSLKEITDLTYRDAPYDVFRHWRKLDKQISRLQRDYNPFFDNSPIREEIEDKLERVFDTFPLEHYPQHEVDLSDWYFSMTRELDMGMENVQRLHEVNIEFWGIVTLSAAKTHHPNMTEEEVLRELGITSFEEEIENRRSRLRGLERSALNDRFDEGEKELTGATDAIVTPILKTL